jgi:hypothetical protein
MSHKNKLTIYSDTDAVAAEWIRRANLKLELAIDNLERAANRLCKTNGGKQVFIAADLSRRVMEIRNDIEVDYPYAVDAE